MNEEAHWNNIAAHYDDEIFDVFRSDKAGKLSTYFKKYQNPLHEAIDFGCGVGKAFPYLAPVFREILAIDISAECLAQAKLSPYRNITFKRADLSKSGLRLPLADFAFCCNVIMLPEVDKNERMILNIQKALKINGSGIIVVPSFESIFYSTFRLMEWYRKEGVTPKEIPASELAYYKGNKMELLQGIVKISGVSTKHYLEPELHVLFRNAGLSVLAIDKVEYDWNTEFSDPPSWMDGPHPWDWLIECRKLQ